MFAVTNDAVTPTDGNGTNIFPRSFLTVVQWELRRIGTNRATWIIALGAFALFCFLIQLVYGVSQYTIPSAHGPRTFTLAWMSNFGLYNTLPLTPGIYLGLLVPFLNADGVARDMHRRTHELLMTTAVSSRAYVWGRYIAGLVLSLGLAILLWVALLGVAVVTHHANPAIVPTPDIAGMTLLWALLVLPPTILLSGVSFALGTLAPRLATFVKVGLMLGWFTLAEVVGNIAARTGSSIATAAWDPSSIALADAQTTSAILHRLATQTQYLSDAAFLERVQAMEQQLPDIQPVLLPHLFWCGVGIVLVAGLPLVFRRFR